MNGVTITYVLDLNAGLTQVLSDGTDTYLYGLGRIREEDTAWDYYLGDALGSVRQLTDGSGIVTLAQTFEPYGKVWVSVGMGSSSYAYTGEAYDGYIKLIYLRSRYYAPTTGRFLTKDVWQGEDFKPQSLNEWNYVESNPINRLDPTGLYWWGPGQALFDASELHGQSQNIHIRIQALWMMGRMKQIHAEYPGMALIPVQNVDLLDSITGEVWEIKPWDDAVAGAFDVTTRIIALNFAKKNEMLNGMNPVAMPYNWNESPAVWFNGLSFPAEVYIGTDDSGWFDFYAGQIAPGVILWWKFPRETPKQVPIPIVLPDDVTWSDRNRRKDWVPQGVPAPVFSSTLTYPETYLQPTPSENLAEILIVTCAILAKELIEFYICGPCAPVLP